MFGRLTANGVSQAFLFLHDYPFCFTTEARVFGDANQGFKEAYVKSGTVYLLGYHLDQGVQKEVVSTIQLMTGLKDAWSVRFDDAGFTTLIKDLTTEEGTAVNNGFWPSADSRPVVVDD